MTEIFRINMFICSCAACQIHPHSENCGVHTKSIAKCNCEQSTARVTKLSPRDDELILRRDGDQWMCVHGDFTNLQESPSYWGNTPELALSQLLKGTAE